MTVRTLRRQSHGRTAGPGGAVPRFALSLLLLMCLNGNPIEQAGCEAMAVRSLGRSPPPAPLLSPRLRGGSEHQEMQMPRHVPSRVVLVPDDFEDLKLAVARIEEQQEGAEGLPREDGGDKRRRTERAAGKRQGTVQNEDGAQEIVVGTGLPEHRRQWGTRSDEFSALAIRGAMSVRMDEGISLSGPIVLKASSRGTLIRWRWGCSLSLRLPQDAAMLVAGAPWHMQHCILRATEMPVLRACAAAKVSLNDSFVGGVAARVSALERGLMGSADGREAPGDSGEGERCTHALVVDQQAVLTAADCTLQYCGAYCAAAVVAASQATVRLVLCFLFQNLGCGISVHGSSNVEVAQCSLIELGSGCFRAVLAGKASLRVLNTTLGGKVWADEARPGLFEEEGRLSHTTPLRTSLPLREPSPVQTAVTAEVDKKSAQTASLWEALSQELAANASDVIEALEFCCNATASNRYVLDMSAINLSRVDVLEDRLPPPLDDEWEDLPPLLLADFSSLSADDSTSTICVYVHVEPLLLSAMRDPSQIADSEALLIEHSDRFLSRRRFGGDAARIVAWLAALDAYKSAGARTPVRVKMVFDFLEEAHSCLLQTRLAALSRAPESRASYRAGGFLHGVDFVCVMHGDWLTPERPCLITSFRGLSSHVLSVSAPHQDLHSGYYGGAVTEPFSDLVQVLGQLMSNASLHLAGLSTTPLTPDEMAELRRLRFRDAQGQLPPGWEVALKALHESGPQACGGGVEEEEDEDLKALGRTWWRSSMSVHGVSGGWTVPGCRTVIPAKVEAKLSIRFPALANITCTEVAAALQVRVAHLAGQLHSNNTIALRQQCGWEAWTASPTSRFYEAASRALARVHGVEADVISDGGSMPVMRMFEEVCESCDVGVLSLFFRDSTRYSDDSLRVTSEYMLEGAKTLVAFLEELAVEV